MCGIEKNVRMVERLRLTGERVDRRMRRTLLIRSGRCKDRSRDRKCGGRHFPQAGRRFPKFNRLRRS